MDAHQLQRWNLCKEKMDDLKIKFELKDNIFLKLKDGRAIGIFNTIDELYAFLCGVEWGRNL
jgi:hypothetical protein